MIVEVRSYRIKPRWSNALESIAMPLLESYDVIIYFTSHDYV
jgi:hypothetical protein